ncbi:MAG: CoA activase [candidate division Zixibacteria bacterium]|nr:CoA activase [candidate division Zixibacteria bacterium]
MPMNMDHYLGIDIGSVALKAVAVSSDGQIRYSDYRRLYGQPGEVLREALADLRKKVSPEHIVALVSTGNGGELAHKLLGGDFANEVLSVSKAAQFLTPDVNTMIEMGGADSKLLCYNRTGDQLALADFAMNSLCAAGTGSFLDQQANRLDISIEGEFGQMALKSQNPPRIAGRCSVFAKSDMIHLQQIATPDYDIVAGLCYAVARNFKSAIARGKKIKKPIAFVGGVASNAGMVKAFEDILEMSSGELVIPEEHRIFCAYGAAMIAREKGLSDEFDLEACEKNEKNVLENSMTTRERLEYSFPQQKHYKTTLTLKRGPEPKVTEGYLGVDIGSLSTNLVVIDKDRNVLARRYLMTAGRPIEAVRKGLAEIGEELNDTVKIIGCGTTGSGRYLIGDFIGADIVRNEITAQATAAIMLDKKVDTIFEIGGQDSKYISIDNGIVVDFEMNKACAAGTGSFLQEQAEKLGIRINEEFGDRALKAGCPVGCGERCTVFMESDLNAYQQAGAEKDDLVAGLAYSIAKNYLTRVVGKRRIGDHIFFQGGVAWNKGVVAAFEKIVGKPVHVPPHHDVTGAIGAAMIAMENPDNGSSRFRGFDLSKRKYTVEPFICEDCSNMCEIRKVTIEGEEPLYYGSRCEKYDTEVSTKDNRFDFVKFRNKALYSSIEKVKLDKKATTIGFPRVLIFHELYPFWASFFRKLGYKVMLSRPTNQKTLNYSLENFSAETCFPIKVVNGHVKDLLDKQVDYIFLPSIINVREDGAPHENSFLCPHIQSIPYTIAANFDMEKYHSKLINVPISMEMKADQLIDELEDLRKHFDWTQDKFEAAIEAGLRNQNGFYDKIAEKGREFIGTRDESKPAICIISRPYNGCDAKLSLEIPKKLLGLGVDVIPMEALPLSEKYGDLTDANMYWRFGQKILAAAEIIRDIPNLYPVYITNFGCGPDSFITHFFQERLGGKPYLQIEIDEHSADAGIVTRLEAFLDSLKSKQAKDTFKKKVYLSRFSSNGVPRTVYIPYMSDHAVPFAAAFRACGMPSEALPEPTPDTLEFGKKYTSGKECFPCQVTTGDIVGKVNSPDFDRKRSAFFMPSASGPCRFGQYHLYQRQVLDELGYSDVPIVSPDSRTGYDDDAFGSDDFKRAGWTAIVSADLLYKIYHHFRPHQDDKSEIDKLYKGYLFKLADYIEHRKDLEPFFMAALADFKKMQSPNGKNLPIIGVVGEIFLRANRFSNNFLVEHLENLGAKVWLAPMAEWVFYTNFTYRRRLKKESSLGEFVTANLTNFIQHKAEKKIVGLVAEEIPSVYDPPVEEIIKLAKPYIDVSLSGEAILSVGKAIEYVHNGASGIVNTLPFMCMPGTIVSAVGGKVSEDLGGVPWLNMAYEGLSDKGDDLKLEAFVHQARQFAAAR